MITSGNQRRAGALFLLRLDAADAPNVQVRVHRVLQALANVLSMHVPHAKNVRLLLTSNDFRYVFTGCSQCKIGLMRPLHHAACTTHQMLEKLGLKTVVPNAGTLLSGDD